MCEMKCGITPRAQDVEMNIVGDETVLLDLASGTYFGLDGVGKRIWETVSDGRSLAETVEVVIAEFEVDKAQAEADVLEFANDLKERGLLVA